MQPFMRSAVAKRQTWTLLKTVAADGQKFEWPHGGATPTENSQSGAADKHQCLWLKSSDCVSLPKPCVISNLKYLTIDRAKHCCRTTRHGVKVMLALLKWHIFLNLCARTKVMSLSIFIRDVFKDCKSESKIIALWWDEFFSWRL